MCIILYFILLGVPIREEAYSQLSKKYLSEGRNNHETLSEVGSNAKDSRFKGKPGLREAITQKNLKSVKSMKVGLSQYSIRSKPKLTKTKTVWRSSAFDETNKRASAEEEFKESIKDSLHVDPLPPVKIKIANFKDQCTRTEPCEV